MCVSVTVNIAQKQFTMSLYTCTCIIMCCLSHSYNWSNLQFSWISLIMLTASEVSFYKLYDSVLWLLLYRLRHVYYFIVMSYCVYCIRCRGYSITIAVTALCWYYSECAYYCWVWAVDHFYFMVCVPLMPPHAVFTVKFMILINRNSKQWQQIQ